MPRGTGLRRGRAFAIAGLALLAMGMGFAQTPASPGAAVVEAPEQWLSITASSALDLATLREAGPQLRAGYVRDGIGTTKIPSVPESKRVFVDCDRRRWGYSASSLQPVNADYEYQVRLAQIFCSQDPRPGSLNERPLHSVNAAAATSAEDFALALRKLRYDAQAGDAAAAWSLHGMYRDGRGVDKDPAQAAHWLRQAAQRGIVVARFNLGASLLEGKDGFAADRVEGARWIRLAAEAGDMNGLYWLGHVYQHGLGLPKDLELAEKFFREAEGAGSTLAGPRLQALQAERERRR